METVFTPKCVPISRPKGGGELKLAKRRNRVYAGKTDYIAVFYPKHPERFNFNSRIEACAMNLREAVGLALGVDFYSSVTREVSEYLTELGSELPSMDSEDENFFVGTLDVGVGVN